MSLNRRKKYGWREATFAAFLHGRPFAALFFAPFRCGKRFAEMNTTKAEKKPLFPLKAHSKSRRPNRACFLYAPVPSDGAAGLGKHLSCGTQAPVGRACRPHYHAFLIGMALGRFFVGNARRKASQLDNHKIQPNTSRRRSRAFLHTGTVGKYRPPRCFLRG